MRNVSLAEAEARIRSLTDTQCAAVLKCVVAARGRPALMPFCRFDCSINGLTALPSGLSRLVNLQW
jgi:hypothetical protein